MRENGHGSEVVGHDHERKFLPARRKMVVYRLQYFFVHALYRSDLAFDVALVSALVGSFQVHEHEVAASVEQVARRLRLSGEVGGESARRALDVHAFHSGADGYALEQIDRAHHAAFKPVSLLEIFQRGTGALSPEPHAVGRILT